MNEAARVRGQRLLEADIRRLQDRGLGEGLRRVVWAPDARPDVQGEVKADTVLLYANELRVARRVLVHEVAHSDLARTQEPLIATINALLATINKECYGRTEKLADVLAGVIDDDP